MILVLAFASFGLSAIVTNYHQSSDDAVDGVARTARLAGALGESLATLAQQELVVLGRSEPMMSGDPAVIQRAIDLINPPTLGFLGGIWWLDPDLVVGARWAQGREIDVAATEAVRRARDTSASAVQSLPSDEGSAIRSVVFAVPQIDLAGRLAGVLVGVVELDSERREVVESLFGSDAVLAVDSEGRRVVGVDVTPLELRIAATAAERTRPDASQPADGSFLEPVDGLIPDLDGFAVAVARPRATDWVVVVVRERSDLLAPAQRQLRRSTLALGLLVAAALLGSALLSVWLTRSHRRETESGELFRTVLEQLPVGVAALDRSGRVAATNERADEVLGARLPVGAEAPSALAAAIEAMREATNVVHPDVQLDRPGGEDDSAVPDRRHLVVRAAPVVAAGQVAGAAAIVEDVTEAVERAVRSRRLARATAALASASSREEVAAVVADAARAFGAGAAIVVLRDTADPGQLVLASTAGFAEGSTERWQRFPLDSPTPVAEAVRTGLDVYVTVRDAADRYPSMAHLFDVSEHTAWAALPLRSAGRVDGALGLSFARIEEIPESERTQFVLFAAQVSQALDRVMRQYMERDVALVLQRGLLQPANGPLERAEVASRYVPAEDHLEVGGDFFDVLPLDDGSVMLVIGDVVGHGIEAASAMGQLRSATRALASTTSSPARLLELLDRFVGVVPACRFATAAIVVADPDRRHVTYSTAGHPPPVWISASGRSGVLADAGSRPLGVVPGSRPERSIAVADLTLCLYTDGLIERRGEVIDEGLDRLRRALDGRYSDPCEVLADSVLADVVGSTRQRDDIALLVARFPTDPSGC